MEEAKEAVIKWFDSYYGDKTYIYLGVMAAFLLILVSKEARRRVVYPALIIFFSITNPYIYKILFEDYNTYWRIFWAVPVNIIIGLALTFSLTRIKNKFLVPLLALIVVLPVTLVGFNMYSSTLFLEKVSDEKLAQITIDIGEEVLLLEDNPYCLVDSYTLRCELRQYDARIRLLYGRDGYISALNRNQRYAQSIMNSSEPDFEKLLTICTSEGINVLIINQDKEIPEEYLVEYGYEYVKTVDELLIYHYAG